MQAKILSSEYLFNDLWFKVRRDRFQTTSGKIIDPYYVYEFPTWVTAVALTEDQKIIMLHQYRHALGEVCIELPGGCVDDTDKSLEEAISRELMEETGYVFNSYEYLGKTSPNPSTNNNLMHMFLARGGKPAGKQALDNNEELEVELMTVEQVLQLLRENRIVQSMHVTCLMYGLAKLNFLKY